MTPFPVFLINLAGSDDRLTSAQGQLDAAGIAFERIDAVDGRKRAAETFETYDDAAARLFFGRSMASGEVGCYLSHAKAAQAVLDSGAPYGLVLEDDFKAAPQAWPVLNDVIARLNAGVLPDWELVNLCRAPRMVTRPLARLTAHGGEHQLIRAYYFPILATAILWSRAGAQRFVTDYARPVGPVDHVYRRMMCDSGLGLALDPAPFGVTGVESDIAIASGQSVKLKNPWEWSAKWNEASRQISCIGTAMWRRAAR